jgi:Protein of unknown function (DUF3667)
MSSAHAPPLTAETRCLNCGVILSGAYCHACGQKGSGPPLHFHDFVHELVHESLHFDSKIWLTLRLLLFSPGTLTRDLIAGRRVRYVGPVRLFLVGSAILFGLLAFTSAYVATNADNREAAAHVDAALDEELSGAGAVKGAVLRVVRKGLHDPRHFRETIVGSLSKSSFILVPIFALVTWKLLAKEQPFYVGHLYFALHLHAFAFLLLAAITALALVPGPLASLAGSAFVPVTVVYFYAAIRRAFQSSWARTLVRGSLLLVLCSALNGIVISAFLLGSIFLL